MTRFPPPDLRFLKFHDHLILIAALNEVQISTLSENCDLATKTALENGESLVVAVLDPEQLEGLYRSFEPVSRSWRGQYQALAKAIVQAYQDHRRFSDA